MAQLIVSMTGCVASAPPLTATHTVAHTHTCVYTQTHTPSPCAAMAMEDDRRSGTTGILRPDIMLRMPLPDEEETFTPATREVGA